MNFNASNSPIYIQIFDSVCNDILSGKFQPQQRILSVRDMGIEMGVNPNTVVRAYEKLTEKEIIYNKRGLGYFISPNAKDIVLNIERKKFLEQEVPRFKEKMALLGIEQKEIFY